MTILRERIVWRAPTKRRAHSRERLDRLTPGQEANVIRAMRALHGRLGTWVKVARALQVSIKTVEKVLAGKDRTTPGWALRIAQIAGVTVDDVLTGAFPKAGACPACGRCD